MSKPVLLPTVKPDDPTPKYIQAQRILTDAIETGRLPEGSKLPSTKQIGALVNVSLITAHKALELLVQEGLLRREVGRGTFVCDDVNKALAHRNQLYLGLVFERTDNVNDYYHASIIEAVRQASRASGDVEFFFHDHYALPAHPRRPVNGMICVHPPLNRARDLTRLVARTPVVVLGGTFTCAPMSCIDCDNQQGARDAIDHLVNLGHTRIIVLAGPHNQSNSCERVEGARAAFQARNLVIHEEDFLTARDHITLDDLTERRLRMRLTGRQRATAIVACGYYLALGAIHVIRRAHIRIPEEVSIVGFDDPTSSALLDPPLTTVRQPLDAMTRQAYDVLRKSLRNGSTDPVTIKLPTELIVRGSTAPPPPAT